MNKQKLLQTLTNQPDCFFSLQQVISLITSIDSEENLMKPNQLPIDYVGIGAIFPTTSKPNVNTFWGIPGLQRLVPLSKHPIIAIGGVNENNAADVILSGAHGIAVINALHNTDNPCQKARNVRHIVDNRGQPHAS